MSRPGRPPEAGFTLIEMTVAIAIFTVVLTLILPTMSVITKSTNSTDALTAVDTTLRAPLLLMTSQISSAGDVTVLCGTSTITPCSAGTTSGTGILLYVNTSGDSLTGSGTSSTSTSGTCWEWRLSSGALQYRSWTTANGNTTAPTGFTSATPSITVSSPSNTPFTYNGAGVALDLFANGGGATKSTEFRTTVFDQGGANGGSNACTPSSGSY